MTSQHALVIVESPAKAKTIEGYLGKGFKVLASFGHVRDLPSKENAVEPDNDFAMHYQVSDAKSEQTLKGIMAALKDADTLYLATDLDREGEAISWHVWEEIKRRNPKKAASLHVHRIEFTEITKSAIQQALREPRALALNLINAQQARRALDYLVGFTLSPVLWRKVKGGLSAGRVQSVALRLIAEREDAIEAFKAEEYWSLHGQFTTPHNKPLAAQLVHYAGKKVEKFSFTSEAQATAAQKVLQPLKFAVKALERADKRRYPSPPFITSTLQQEAARKLGFAARRTMQTAQRLYEAGHITYMRTDSVNLAHEAVSALRQLIGKKYGPEFVPSSPNTYKSKSKNAQEAHEAIRPTNPAALPGSLGLEDDQNRLYQLIWQRTLACQMAPARLEQTTITLAESTGQHMFRATGSVVLFAGFMAAYQEGRDDDDADANTDESGEALLPVVHEADAMITRSVDAEQHFTQPPPRFTEATLVKALEEYGIGRPSTYASIIATLQDRRYVRLEQKRFFPEDVGRIVSRFLVEHFTQYVDYNFTAEMEDDLDAIARGEHDWKPTLRKFWQPFKTLAAEKTESVKKSDVTTEATGETCPQCSVGELVYRLGKYGRFKGCNRYPECTYIEKTGPAAAPGVSTGIGCPSCKKEGAELVQKTSRLGKIFWSCGTYPTCTYAVWDAPLNQPCPKCGWGCITTKQSKKFGEWHRCPQPTCDWNDNQEAADATAAFRARFAKKAPAKAEKAAPKAAAKPAAKTAKPKAAAKRKK